MNGHPHDDGSSQEYSIEYTVLRPFEGDLNSLRGQKMNGSKTLCCGQCPLERIVPFFLPAGLSLCRFLLSRSFFCA